MMPISCMECRRRKIKCNKMIPCNQCTVKDRPCEYPAKFRSIRVEQLVVDGLAASESEPNEKGLPTAPNSSKSVSPEAPAPANGVAQNGGVSGPNPDCSNDNVTENGYGVKRQRTNSSSDGEVALTVSQMHKENEALKLKIRDLRLKNKRQKTKLRKLLAEQPSEGILDDDDDDDDNEDGTHKDFDGATQFEKEGKDIYYGPNSTRYMISSSMNKDDAADFDDFIRVKRQIKQKRLLPELVHPRSNSAKARKLAKEQNMEIILGLVKKFFHLKVHYMNFLSPEPLLEFLHRYDDIKDWQRSDDDRLLMCLMTMIVALRSVPPSDPLIRKYNLSYRQDREPLYKQYKNLKRGVQIETTMRLRAYVLEIEDLFYKDEIEKSWNLLFQTVSSAYSLGLHVYDESIVEALRNEEHQKSSDVIKKNPKTSLWLVINFVSATMCSVLGRPNPVTFNFQPLLKNYEIRLNYKIALAELVKKSTSIVIDSYKIPIGLDTVIDIDELFVNEVLIYEKILIDTRVMRNMRSRDVTKPSFITLPVIDKKDANGSSKPNMGSDGTKYATATVGVKLEKKTSSLSQLNLTKLLSECPLDIRFTILRPCLMQKEEEPFCLILEDSDTLADLIMLYGNRAKFHQHFMTKYEKSLEAALDSILKVLEHSQDLIELMLKKFTVPHFQEIYPFFYVFMYQTLVVMYTLMHLGYSNLAPHYNEIGQIRQRLIKLFDTVTPKYWRPNVIRIIQYINDMCDNFFKTYLEKEQQIPKSTTLPPLAYNGKTSTVRPTSFQLQQENLLAERKLQEAESNHSSSVKRENTPMFQLAPFDEPVQQQQQQHSDVRVPRGQAAFQGLHLHSIPDEIRSQVQGQVQSQVRAPPVLEAGSPDCPSTAPSPSVDGSGVPVSNGHVAGGIPMQPAQFYLNQSAGSLSQMTLTNYSMDYYDPSEPMLPPTPRQQQSTLHSANGGRPGNNVQQIDPLLGFDLSDPFFVQNPFNFNYAPPPDIHPDDDDGSKRSSNPANFFRDNSMSSMATRSDGSNVSANDGYDGSIPSGAGAGASPEQGRPQAPRQGPPSHQR